MALSFKLHHQDKVDFLSHVFSQGVQSRMKLESGPIAFLGHDPPQAQLTSLSLWMLRCLLNPMLFSFYLTALTVMVSTA